mmetsp:Transcript_18227/g.40269  ORF Transcript_18227/g.40269 Transcript_18227/m.40269 type:complete len:417 (-) Transcript_18227:961-2211(-)
MGMPSVTTITVAGTVHLPVLTICRAKDRAAARLVPPLSHVNPLMVDRASACLSVSICAAVALVPYTTTPRCVTLVFTGSAVTTSTAYFLIISNPVMPTDPEESKTKTTSRSVFSSHLIFSLHLSGLQWRSCRRSRLIAEGQLPWPMVLRATWRYLSWCPRLHCLVHPVHAVQLASLQSSSQLFTPQTLWTTVSPQGMPPCRGACSMVRDRVCTPPPQDLVHWDQGPNCVILQSTGHALMLHFRVTSSTGHLASAEGFAITSRFRVCTPPLQEAEQGPRIHLVTSHSFTLPSREESALKISSRSFIAASMVFSTLFILAQQAPTPLSTAPLISLYSSSLLFNAVASTVDWAEASASIVLKSSNLSRVSRMSTVFAARICSQFLSALARRNLSSSAASLTFPCTVAMLSTKASQDGLS